MLVALRPSTGEAVRRQVSTDHIELHKDTHHASRLKVGDASRVNRTCTRVWDAPRVNALASLSRGADEIANTIRDGSTCAIPSPRKPAVSQKNQQNVTFRANFSNSCEHGNFSGKTAQQSHADVEASSSVHSLALTSCERVKRAKQEQK